MPLYYSSKPFFDVANKQTILRMLIPQKTRKLPASEEWSIISYPDCQRLGICCYSTIKLTPSKQVGNFSLVKSKRRHYRLRYNNWAKQKPELYRRLEVTRDLQKLQAIPPNYKIEIANLDEGGNAIRLIKPSGKYDKAFIFLPKVE